MNTHRVAVLFTETDLAKVKAAAGRVPLSRWLRDLAVLEASVEPLPDEEKPDFSNFKTYAPGDEAKKPETAKPTKKNSKRTPPVVVNQPMSAAAAKPILMCSHDYGPKACPFPNCKNNKWRE